MKGVIAYGSDYEFRLPPMRYLVSTAQDQPPVIHGDGEQTRDYTFVGDAVEATLLAAVSPRAEGQVYNVGTGRETSVNQLAELIIRISGHELRPEHIDRRDIDNIRRRVLNMEKARRELRFVPATTLESGLRATHDWLLRQQGWHGPPARPALSPGERQRIPAH